jgi:hypothetical protein
MKWLGRRESGNVEDRRRISGGQVAVGGGVIGLIFLLFNLFMGGDASQVLEQLQQQVNSQQSTETITQEDDEMAHFVSVVLADNEDVWHTIFSANGMIYEEPQLVLFRSATQSGCGNASSSTGPFYCPADRKVYMDLAFFDDLKNRFGAEGGDFAVAYVIAHEVGHHVQNLLGISGKVHNQQQQLNDRDANKLSVALELQADFFAGLWTHHNEKMNSVLEDGDIEEALSAAAAVGDDHIQKMSRGTVMPDAFTHGTSEQRMYWFKRGLKTGDLQQGDTFKELL